MIAALDVHYFDDFSMAAAVVFENWGDDEAVEQFVIRCDQATRYEAGQFYQRELLPLKRIVEAIDKTECSIKTYIVDAYCHLSDERQPGLGAYLSKCLYADTAVIGVAKNRYRETKHAIEVRRGKSDKPLFVTSIGIDYFEAANQVASMHGPFRIPTLLKMVDGLARN